MCKRPQTNNKHFSAKPGRFAIWLLWNSLTEIKRFGLFLAFFNLMKIVSFAYFGKISTKHTTFYDIPKFIWYILVNLTFFIFRDLSTLQPGAIGHWHPHTLFRGGQKHTMCLKTKRYTFNTLPTNLSLIEEELLKSYY